MPCDEIADTTPQPDYDSTSKQNVVTVTIVTRLSTSTNKDKDYGTMP